MVLLGFKAGLRACEIAGLEWPMLLDTSDAVDDQIVLARGITKGVHNRSVPIHRQLKIALIKLHYRAGHPRDGSVIMSERGDHMTAASAVNWFRDAYSALGLNGCSSHSGRRIFITSSH